MVLIKQFEDISHTDLPLVGGKNASLGEMIKNLSAKGIEVPSGFAVTTAAYRQHLEENNLTATIQSLLTSTDKNNLESLAHLSHKIRLLIQSAPLPTQVATLVQEAYAKLEHRYGNACDVAVRSSATAEDLADASFAGQQDTFLNIRGVDQLLHVIPQVFASLFTSRAIAYRIDQGFSDIDLAISVGVQKMVRSDLACSGVMFTLDTESGYPDAIFITAAYGLGESVVQGSVNPDEFYVHKPTLRAGFRPILKKRLGTKETKLIYGQASHATTTAKVGKLDRLRYTLTDEEILQLARQAVIIEEHYSALRGTWTPMDIEWAKDGVDGKLYILQARPETVHSQKLHTPFIEEFRLEHKEGLEPLVTGKSIGRKISSGRAVVLHSAHLIGKIKPGDIIVTDMTDPDWEPVMKIAGGIITNRGGRTCHAAIISRELGIPAIVGTHNATTSINDGQVVTLDCSSGETGFVYEGAQPFTLEKIPLRSAHAPVELMVNIGNPDEAFNIAQLPNDGVGLARLEFIINNSIQVHPLALLNPELVLDQGQRNLIEELTVHYPSKQAFFVDRLAQEAGTIAAAFYPRPVIIRMSDFKSNEYRNLIGGSFFEPEEENPMLGFRGASRYYHPRYAQAFSLECAAMKKIRDEMGLSNVRLMIPFVRTLQEARSVLALMAERGLARGQNGLEIYMMCEIPSNVILIEQFADLFDGFSIGSNDLTQMTLGVDRDSQLVASIFDERDDSVKIMLSIAIQGARKKGKKIGICGQAPSDYPELASFLIDEGINSISLNPDSITKMYARLSAKSKGPEQCL